MPLPAVMKLINAEFHSDSDVCYYRADRAVAKKYPESVFKNFLLKNAEGEKMYIKTQSQHRIENLSKIFQRTCQFYLNISNYFYILLYIFNFLKSFKCFADIETLALKSSSIFLK